MQPGSTLATPSRVGYPEKHMDAILITGGAGFIGSCFVKLALRDPGLRVVVLDALTYAGNRASIAGLAGPERLDFVHGDITDRPLVDRLLASHQPRWLVNFAAESHVDRSIDGPRAFVHTNTLGTFELLEATRTFLATLAAPEREAFRFLHVSTDEVFGSLGPTGAFTETTPYDPSSPYSASKAAGDHLVRAWHRTFGLPALVTNCSNNFGPRQYPEKLIPLMLLNALEGRDLPIYGDGGNVRDWIYVEDHCEGILEVLRRGKVGETYNLGGGNERTNLEIITALCQLLEARRPARENLALRARGLESYPALETRVADRPGHDRRYAIDGTKVRRDLGFSPRYTFEAALAETVDWYLGNLAWCATVTGGDYDRQRLGLATERAR